MPTHLQTGREGEVVLDEKLSADDCSRASSGRTSPIMQGPRIVEVQDPSEGVKQSGDEEGEVGCNGSVGAEPEHGTIVRMAALTCLNNTVKARANYEPRLLLPPQSLPPRDWILKEHKLVGGAVEF